MALAISPTTEETYRRHVAAVYRFCLWRANSSHDAEDAATEVFVKLMAGKAKNVESERLLGWLLRVADNECKMLARRRHRRAEVPLEQAPEIGRIDQQPWISPHVCRAVNSLRPMPKRVVFLKAVEEMSFKKIAAVLSITEGAAKMIFYRAIKRLAKILGDEWL